MGRLRIGVSGAFAIILGGPLQCEGFVNLKPFLSPGFPCANETLVAQHPSRRSRQRERAAGTSVITWNAGFTSARPAGARSHSEGRQVILSSWDGAAPFERG